MALDTLMTKAAIDLQRMHVSKRLVCDSLLFRCQFSIGLLNAINRLIQPQNDTNYFLIEPYPTCRGEVSNLSSSIRKFHDWRLS